MHARSVPARHVAPWIALLGVLATPSLLLGQYGQAVAVTKGHGYTLEVQSGWVLGQGYRPVRVVLRSGAVATDDREYTIEIEINDYSRRRSTTASDRLLIPAGARSGSVVITVPQIDLWLQDSVEVYEGGRHLDKLDASFSPGNGWVYQSVLLPSFLCVSDRSIDTGLLTEAVGLTQNSANGLSAMYGNLVTNTINGRSQYPSELFALVAPADLPRRWLDYSSADVVCLSVTDLVALGKQQPETLQAICDAIAAGGNLWIWGAGPNWERLAEVEQYTKLWGPHAEAWYDPKPQDFKRGLDGAFATNRSVDFAMPGTPVTGTETVDSLNNPAQGLSPPATAPFRLRAAQFGRVLVFSGEQPFGANPPPPADVANWVWAMNSVGANRLLGKKRHGTSMSDDNPDFWKLMIPGVGRAPVTAFRVLITIFVIAIGPVNYYWLRRKGKLHLLLAVVPITAIVVTAGLFGYALFTDGLQIRVRPRSFTSLDQARQHAACWARTTYYAGLSPASGMRFEDDTIVLPIEPNAGRGYSSHARRLNWDGDRQQMANGWLYSRTPTQYLSIRSRPSTNGLRIKPATDGGAPAITNGLGANVIQLLLCDEQGRWYTAGETARGAVCKLTEIDGQSGVPEFSQYLAARAAVTQSDMQLTDASYGGMGFRSYAYYGQGSYTPQQQEGLLETSLAEVDAWLRAPISLPPRNYVAIVDKSPEVDYGLESPQQELPVHVIHGQW